MFHKDGSSVFAKGGKKAMNTPLRKSDRRELRKAAMSMFDRDDATTSSRLNSVFLDGTLTARNLLHASLGKVVLYFRSPTPLNEVTANAGHQGTDTSWSWPYTASTQCIWMTADLGPNQLVHAPAVALMAVLPHFPSVGLHSSTISMYLCRGAHLMRAGIRSLPQSSHSNVNGVVAIRIPGNDQPFAVGRLTLGTTADNIGLATQGVGVEIWTCYGDDLWSQQVTQDGNGGLINPIGGALFDQGDYGNVGFRGGRTVSPILFQKESMPNFGDDVHSTEKSNSSLQCLAEVNSGSTTDQTNSSTGENGANNNNLHEALLHETCCKALANVRDEELPMTTANLYARRVLPNRPTDTTIQLKQTRWKKFGPYLAEQADRGLVELKAHGDDPVGFVVAVNRKHEELHGMKKNTSSEADQQKMQLTIAGLFVLPHHWVKLLRLDPTSVSASNATSIERRGTGLLTTPEARVILENYLSRNELLLSQTEVQLDGALADALYKKEIAPERLSRKDLMERWMQKLDAAYAVVEMPGSKIRKLGRGAPPKVKIEVSLRGARKFVTRVRGLEEFGVDGSDFCSDVVKRFACSGVIEREPTGRAALKKGCVELVFQGRLDKELQALLLGDEQLSGHGGSRGATYALPKGSIEVELKKGVRTRKGRK